MVKNTFYQVVITNAQKPGHDDNIAGHGIEPGQGIDLDKMERPVAVQPEIKTRNVPAAKGAKKLLGQEDYALF